MTPRGLLEVSEAVPSGQGSEDREGWPLEREPRRGGRVGKGSRQAGSQSQKLGKQQRLTYPSRMASLATGRVAATQPCTEGNKKQVVAQAPASHSGLRGTCVSPRSQGKTWGTGEQDQVLGLLGTRALPSRWLSALVRCALSPPLLPQ